MTKLLESYESTYNEISAAITRLEHQIKSKQLTSQELRSANIRIDILRSERADVNSCIKDMYRYLAPKPQTPSMAALAAKGVQP